MFIVNFNAILPKKNEVFVKMSDVYRLIFPLAIAYS